MLNAVGLGQQANVLHSPQAAVDLARQAWTAGADGMILSCGNFRALESIPEIENMLGKPLIASNCAALWNALTAARWQGSVPNAGALLRDIGRHNTNAAARA